jgi:hypothetical protein
VSNVAYFSYDDPNTGPGYYVRMDVSDANHSTQGQQAPYDFQIVDSAGQMIEDISSASGAGQPPGCFDADASPVNVLPGQTARFPQPVCFELGSAADRARSFVDVDFELTIRI